MTTRSERLHGVPFADGAGPCKRCPWGSARLARGSVAVHAASNRAPKFLVLCHRCICSVLVLQCFSNKPLMGEISGIAHTETTVSEKMNLSSPFRRDIDLLFPPNKGIDSIFSTMGAGTALNLRLGPEKSVNEKEGSSVIRGHITSISAKQRQ